MTGLEELMNYIQKEHRLSYTQFADISNKAQEILDKEKKEQDDSLTVAYMSGKYDGNKQKPLAVLADEKGYTASPYKYRGNWCIDIRKITIFGNLTMDGNYVITDKDFAECEAKAIAYLKTLKGVE